MHVVGTGAQTNKYREYTKPSAHVRDGSNGIEDRSWLGQFMTSVSEHWLWMLPLMIILFILPLYHVLQGLKGTKFLHVLVHVVM